MINDGPHGEQGKIEEGTFYGKRDDQGIPSSSSLYGRKENFYGKLRDFVGAME